MLPRFKTAVQWSLQTTKKVALANFSGGVSLVLLAVFLNAYRELGVSFALHWLLAALFLALAIVLCWRFGSWKRSPIWYNSGWAWLSAGLLVGSLLLWPVRLMWGAPATGYTLSEQLPLIAHLFVASSILILAVGLWQTTRHGVDAKTEDC